MKLAEVKQKNVIYYAWISSFGENFGSRATSGLLYAAVINSRVFETCLLLADLRGYSLTSRFENAP
jgi:hypothetical protein